MAILWLIRSLAQVAKRYFQIKKPETNYNYFFAGSLLVAAAHFGGYVCGTDIDFLTLHGRIKTTRAHQKKREPSEDIKGNLKQYNLLSRYLDVFVGDASRPVWKPDFYFDSILTDRKKAIFYRN